MITTASITSRSVKPREFGYTNASPPLSLPFKGRE
jgi:hypothetical protein